MARAFVAASSQFLERSPAPAIGLPCTMAAWIRPTSLAGAGYPIGLSHSSANNWIWAQVETTGAISAFHFDGSVSAAATSGVGLTNGAWGHIAAVFASNSSRSAYVNGGNAGTNSTVCSNSTIDSLLLGAQWVSGARTGFFGGDIAEAAIWNVALSAAEIAALGAGVSPLLVRPLALVAYWPLLGHTSPEQELFNKYELTLTNAPVAAPHCRIILPTGPQIRRIAASTFVAPVDPAFEIYVAGVNRTHYVDRTSVAIEEALRQTKRLSFQALSFTPAPNATVSAYIGGRKEFEGTLTRPRIKFRKRGERPVWSCQAVGQPFRLDRLLVTGRYEDQSATAIALAIIASFAPSVTTSHVTAGLPTIDAIEFDEVPLSVALQQLVDRFGGGQFIDDDGDAHVFQTETDITPDALSTANTNWRDFWYEPNIEGLANRIKVTGAGARVLAAVAAGASVIPVNTTARFPTTGGTIKAGPQFPTYTGVAAGGPVAPPVGSWNLVPTGGSGSLPFNTVFSYKITYFTAAGESFPSAASANVNTGGAANNREVSLTFTPTAGSVPTNITGFAVYASESTSAGAGPWHLFDWNFSGNAAMFSQLAGGGFTKQHLAFNDALAQPPTTSAAGSDEMFGSTTSGSTAVGATTITVVERGHFNSGGGLALVTVNGTPFVIEYTGKSSSYGTGSLTGVPASGFGSVLFTIATGTAIQNVATLTGVSGLTFGLAAGDEVNLYAVRNDAASQAIYDIREKSIRDSTLATVDDLNGRGDGELTLCKNQRTGGGYTTTDSKVRPGRLVDVSMLSEWGISGTAFVIQSVRTFFEEDRLAAQRTVVFSNQDLDKDLNRILWQLHDRLNSAAVR